MNNSKKNQKKLQAAVNTLRENAAIYFAGLSKEQLLEPESAVDYMEGCLSNETAKEIFGCLFLNSKNRVIKFEILFEGTINQSAVFPRELVKKAFDYDAAGVILCHNHPSGNTEPSKNDIELTYNIKQLFEKLNIRLLDHIIIGEPGKHYSFMEKRLMSVADADADEKLDDLA